MKICLLGYGKMGKAIDNLAISNNVEIKYRISSDNKSNLFNALKEVDVVIEFSKPELAVDHIKICTDIGVPIVCGTTGWLDQLTTVESIVKSSNGALLYSSNFSLGVNIFFNINKKLAKLMSQFNQYQCHIEEIHHLQKLDKPSGTAISLASQIIENHNQFDQWTLDKANTNNNDLNILAYREDGVIGTHKIEYNSSIDQITIQHKALSRDGFALGAILAAKWIVGKKGIYTMDDFLNFDK
ncbi:MAG: 4-hydroxy-tetrahydrodipicolinate reductase [Saprospiraceae bacterium]|nr:4-hydroxy-tetrahydrodipicolinate reductase [Saprospiraceae bacterium]